MVYPPSTKLLGVKVSSISPVDLLKHVDAAIKEKKSLFITTPNPEIIVKAQNDPELLSALNKADIALPDGMGIVIANGVLGTDCSLTRLTGRGAMVDLLVFAQERRLKVYLLGGTKKVNRKATAVISSKYPNIIVKSSSGPLFDNKLYYETDNDSLIGRRVLKEISEFKPDLLFVAFGAPKQEKWINKHIDSLPVHVAMGVGGAFDYISGLVPLPPPFLANLGLEWMWRLLSQPKRFTRILTATVVFPILVIKYRFQNR